MRGSSSRIRLRWGGRLDRYVISHFVGSYGTALFLVVGLYLVLDMASNVGDFLAPEREGGPPRGPATCCATTCSRCPSCSSRWRPS